MIENIFSGLLHLLPRKARYELCRRHLDRMRAENNSDFLTNGEYWLMKTLLPGCETVFDVGAFTGEWAGRALGLNPAVDLHCFEPSPRNFEALSSRGFKNNVSCNRFGLGAEDSRRELYVYDGLSEGNSLYRRRGIDYYLGPDARVRPETVEIRTLDGYCREKGVREIDFVKIDVEGHELSVIEGGKGLFEQERVKTVQFEYGGAYIDSRTLLRDFFDCLEGSNYRFFLLHTSRVSVVEAYDQRLENFQYKNFLIVHRRVAAETPIFRSSRNWSLG